MKDLLNINYWIFDLDNTLYSGQTEVFSEVDKKMSAFISKKMNVDLIKAKEIQKKYFYEYGTTLSGLMKLDNIDPHDFLEFVHDIDISWLPKDLRLKEELIKIKEKKYIFTNGSHAHVENVTKQLGIDGLFDGAFDIVDANFVPKPHIDPYKKIIEKFGQTNFTGLIWKSENEITVSKDKADTLFKLLNMLEENEDVQAVSSNFDVSDEVLASLTA